MHSRYFGNLYLFSECCVIIEARVQRRGDHSKWGFGSCYQGVEQDFGSHKAITG